jgi:hypothetical protein
VVASLARRTGVEAVAARTFFRVFLAVQLLVYTFAALLPVSVIAGVVLGIVILVAGIFSDGGGDILSLLADPTGFAFVLGICVLVGIGWVFKQKYDFLLQLVGAREHDRSDARVGGLVPRVNAYSVGQAELERHEERLDRTWTISQADERRVLARVRAQGGVLRAGDLVAWLGLTLDEADVQATRLVVEYGGEPAPVPVRASDADLIVLEMRFPTQRATAARAEKKRGGRAGADSPTRFERPDPPPRLTGNAPRQDLFVALFAGINLIAGLVAGIWLAPHRHDGAWWWLAWMAGARAPVVFSLLLLGLPLLRLPLHAWRRVRSAVTRAHGRMVGAIVAHVRTRGDAGVSLEALAKALPATGDLPAASPAELRAVALALGGESDLDSPDDPGGTVWRFRRLAAELRHTDVAG